MTKNSTQIKICHLIFGIRFEFLTYDQKEKKKKTKEKNYFYGIRGNNGKSSIINDHCAAPLFLKLSNICSC